jgi:hypothetical protein
MGGRASGMRWLPSKRMGMDAGVVLLVAKNRGAELGMRVQACVEMLVVSTVTMEVVGG